MRKMKMAKRKTQRSANCEANCDVGSEKPKRRRKSRKFTEKLQNVTFHPLRTKTDCGGEVGQDYQARPGQDRAGQAGSQPENALFQCRLPPDAITANEETSCRPPFLFSFFLSHTHRHGRMHRHIYYSEFCVCGTHTATYPVAFDNSPQNVKNDEKLAPERSPSPHDVVFAYVLVMASVVLLFGGCHALLLSCSRTHTLSLSLCCASANIFAAALRARCLVASLASSFLFFFFGSSCACRLSDYQF